MASKGLARKQWWVGALQALIFGGCGTEGCGPVELLQSGGSRRVELGYEFQEVTQTWAPVVKTSLVAMTFNLLYESGLEPLANLTRKRHIPTWAERKENIVKVIRNYQPHVLALQESTQWQVSCLQKQLPMYAFVYGEGLSDAVLAYRKEGFEEVGRGSVRLPYPKGSLAIIPRGAAWAKLRDRLSGKEIFACGAHLDNTHAGYQARRLNGAIQPMAQEADVALLMGDFNLDAHSPTFLRDVKGAFWNDSLEKAQYVKNKSERQPTTFALEQRRIDHILYRGSLGPVYWEVTRLPGSNALISDHFPVTARLDIVVPEGPSP